MILVSDIMFLPQYLLKSLMIFRVEYRLYTDDDCNKAIIMHEIVHIYHNHVIKIYILQLYKIK